MDMFGKIAPLLRTSSGGLSRPPFCFIRKTEKVATTEQENEGLVGKEKC